MKLNQIQDRSLHGRNH